MIQLLCVDLKKFRLYQQLKKASLFMKKSIKSFLNQDRIFVSIPLDSSYQTNKSYTFFSFNSLLKYEIYFHDIFNEADGF